MNIATRPAVFIVYESTELELANKLASLLDSLDCDAFHCRQNGYDGTPYRQYLTEKLRASDLVILVLSREFKWCAYCQAESGAAIALGKEILPLLVPPLTKSEVADVCPILDGFQVRAVESIGRDEFIRAVDGHIRLASTAATRIAKELSAHATKQLGPIKLPVPETALPRIDILQDAVRGIKATYETRVAPKHLQQCWGSLENDQCVRSIVKNVKARLLDRGIALAVVGTSLKFSLGLITEAMSQLESEVRNSGGRTACKVGVPMHVQLVFMHWQSHILHAMKVLDVDIIQKQLISGWPDVLAEWRRLASSLCIDLKEPNVSQIDYVPPRVGLLIDDDLFYGGRCAFVRRGNTSSFDLRVGELPYQFFDANARRDTDRSTAQREISEFKGFLVAYGHKSNNTGVAAMVHSGEWIQRMIEVINVYGDAIDVATVVSGSGTRLRGVVAAIAKKCPSAKCEVLCHDAAGTGLHSDRLREDLVKDGVPINSIQFVNYAHSPTFRAVILADLLIGLQPYISDEGRQGDGRVASCFLITPCYAGFADLKDSLLRVRGCHK